MEVCREMKKLRKWLDDSNIPWEDKSDLPKKVMPDYFIYRTHFEIDNVFVSVINGFGSYGGVNLLSGINEGLLELMSNGVNKGSPIGYLRAIEVIDIIKELQK